MSYEVIVKKDRDIFYVAIPNMGIVEQASTLDHAYQKAEMKLKKIEIDFKELGVSHLLPKPNEFLKIWHITKRTAIISLAFSLIFLLSIGAIAYSVKKEISRGITTFNSYISKDDPNKMEENRKKLAFLLDKYKPLVDEWKKAMKD
jgi:hypothetical protein